MPALAVARAETQWRITLDNPPVNLVDPEMILELQLAGELAGLDRRVLADAKALIDRATLPAEADLVNAYQAFFESAARLTRT